MAPLALEFEEAEPIDGGFGCSSFDSPFVLIGRDPRSDLVLENAQVSRRHAFLQAIAGRILVDRPSQSYQGLLGGRRSSASPGLARSGPIHPGRPVPDSPGWLWSQRGSGSPSMPAPMAPAETRSESEAGPVPGAALELPFRMGDVPSLWPLEGELALVGRADECQFVLTDESVSRFHAALVSTPSGVWVVDLLARDGVYVNGERVRWAWLAEGDSLRMGRFTFILRYETPPDQITRGDVPLEAGASLVEHPGTELAVLTGSLTTGGKPWPCVPRADHQLH